MDFTKKLLNYEQITLLPRKISEIPSRSSKFISTDTYAFGTTISLPILSAPMPDVCESKMAGTLASLGAFGLIHRFLPIVNQVEEYEAAVAIVTVTSTQKINNIGCAIGVTGDYQERFLRLHEAGCRTFCLDTANGANTQVGNAVNWIKQNTPENGKPTYLIAGNVATAEGYIYLTALEVDAVRVGIAGGSVCTTRTETGVYMPMVSSITECVTARNAWLAKDPGGKYPLIIADGGIKTPADMNKALSLGADFIMAGGILAGTKESPGTVFRNRDDGRLYKTYRGAASFSVQYEYKGDEPLYNEGDESFVSYKGAVKDVIHRFEAGLRSSMSYFNAKNLMEFRRNTTIGIL